jgi:hypothetical protein
VTEEERPAKGNNGDGGDSSSGQGDPPMPPRDYDDSHRELEELPPEMEVRRPPETKED